MLSYSLLLAMSALSADTLPPVVPQGTPRPADAAAPAIAAGGSAAAAPAAPLKTARRDFVADSLYLDKSDRVLTLFHRGEKVAEYRVALGGDPVGDKVRRGDRRTPEGLYWISGRNPQSKYHLSLRISYPDSAHRARAAKLGVSPGGDIMIHGLPRAFASVGALHLQQDWTEGCIAVTNPEIEEIWRAVPNGARLLIVP